jgi:hypothetical protein
MYGIFTAAQPQVIPFWLTILGILGIGSFLGNVITLYVSWILRRKEWLRDSKKQEWRELISTLARSVHYILGNSPGHLIAVSGEQEKGVLHANVEARSVIEDRIFIAHQLRRGNILERWQLLVNEGDFSRMAEYWDHLHTDLVAAAHKDCGVKNKPVS